MQFKKGHYIDETTLTEEEAREFVYFLKAELVRHEHEIVEYLPLAKDDSCTFFMRILAHTVIVRHLEDIRHTKATIDYLVFKFDLEL